MKTIGYREKKACIHHVILILVAVALIVLIIMNFDSFDFSTVICLLAAIGTTAYGAFGLVDFLKTPTEVIVLTGGDTLTLIGNVKIKISNIFDVFPTGFQARRLGAFKWGSVTFLMKDGNYHKVKFVSDCKAVSNEIIKIMRDLK